MYVVYGEDAYLVKKQIDKLIKHINNNNEYEIEKFSCIDDDINEIINSAMTLSIFGKPKICLIEDAYFITEQKKTLHKAFNIAKIEWLLDNLPDSNKIIFSLNSKTLSKRLKITNKILNKAKEITVMSLERETLAKLIQNDLIKHDVEITSEALAYLQEALPLDMYVVSNELNKLHNANKEIDLETVKSIVNNYQTENIFELGEYYLTDNIALFISQLRLYLNHNNDIFSLLGLLTNNLVTLKNILLLQQQNYAINDIAKILQANPYRVRKLLELNVRDINVILKKLLNLATLNYNIISGAFDAKVIPEIELLKSLSIKGEY